MSSTKDQAGGKKTAVGADLLRSASKSGENGDPQIRSILNTLLAAAKQPPRTRVRLKIDDIYYLLDTAKEVFKSKSALVEIEVSYIFVVFFLLKILFVGSMQTDFLFLYFLFYFTRHRSLYVVTFMGNTVICYAFLKSDPHHRKNNIYLWVITSIVPNNPLKVNIYNTDGIGMIRFNSFLIKRMCYLYCLHIRI